MYTINKVQEMFANCTWLSRIFFDMIKIHKRKHFGKSSFFVQTGYSRF